MVDSSDFAQVMAEAEDIARSVNQRLTTAHVLLAMFTVENRAALLLKERAIDEDLLLERLTSAPSEQDGLVRELREKTREIAQGCGSMEADCMHALIAITRVRCAAQDLLFKTGLDLTGLRNTALSYFTSGRMPRRLMLSRELPPGLPRGIGSRPVGAPPLPFAKTATIPAPPPPKPATLKPALSARDLIDELTDEEVRELENISLQQALMPAAAPPVPVPAAAPQTAWHLDPRTYPLLTSIGKNLTVLARSGKLEAHKEGRNWVSSSVALKKYLAARERKRN